MTLLINPGSEIGASAGVGWTNTYEVARESAEMWLGQMHDAGMTDVELADGCAMRDHRWIFTFTHRVTGVAVTLETHGIDNLHAYEKEHIFSPRIYWNGSSTANPRLSDWAAEGFIPVRTYRAAPS